MADAEGVILGGGCCGCLTVIILMGLGVVAMLFAAAWRILF